MKNTIEIKDGIVRKTYASRIDYLREEKIYKALSGTGLAPELVDSRDGYLEHKYVEGESFLEIVRASKGNIQKLCELFRDFCLWYEQFRNATKMTLGRVRFDKFLYSNGKLCNLDFESSKPGFLEEDIANLAARICMEPVPFAENGIEVAKVFMSQCYEILKCNSEQIYTLLPKYLKDESKLRDYTPQYSKMVYVATQLCCCGVVFAGGDTELDECTSSLATMPQKLISAPSEKRGVKSEMPGFETVYSNVGINNTLGRIIDIQKRVNQVWSFYLTTDMPKVPKILLDAFYSAEKEELAAVMIEAGGRLREFPILLNTARTRVELESALKDGESSITDILSKMNVRIVKLENIK